LQIDKKNKIIIIVVGVFCFILLSLLIYFLFLSPSNESLKRNENFVEMTIPKVIDGKKLSNNKKASGTLYTHLRRQGRTYRKRKSSKHSRGILKIELALNKGH
tara:strand:- start:541 stop:849 length:309 start_codon:yes stop_codon:yes gene_type:complete